MRILAALLAVPALLLGWQWWTDHSTERKLVPIASAIAGREIAVDCQSFWGALIDPLPRHGEVFFDRDGIPEPRIFLTHDTCKRLRKFDSADNHPQLACLAELPWAQAGIPFGHPCYDETSDTIYAVLTLAHEAYHAAGVRNEATANCYATQAMGYAAISLGASDGDARRLAAAMASLLPYQGGSYRTLDCVPGGTLDLNPETPQFPSEGGLLAPRGKGGMRGLALGAG